MEYGQSTYWNIENTLNSLKNELEHRNTPFSVKIDPIIEHTSKIVGFFIVSGDVRFKGKNSFG